VAARAEVQVAEQVLAPELVLARGEALVVEQEVEPVVASQTRPR